MRRSVSLLVVTFSVFAVSLLAISFSANAGGNCEGKLLGNSYECNYVNSEGGSGANAFRLAPGCSRFISTPGTMAQTNMVAHAIRRAPRNRLRSTLLQTPTSARPPHLLLIC